jgi:Nucleotidyl transferase AbiEii toxin, Type IV TA system
MAVRDTERDFRAALTADLGDWFVFDLGASSEVSAGAVARRIPAIARIGTREWSRFHVDLVGEDAAMTGTPDDVPALAHIGLAGLEQASYRAWPLVDHIADKVAATLETYGARARPSTRVKDLIDLVMLASSTHVEAKALSHRDRCASGAPRHRTADPLRLSGSHDWVPRYVAAVKDLSSEPERTADDALALVAAMLDPVLQGTATGHWDPLRRTWIGTSE